MNLLGQNIGQNYRGIINLGATINSPLSATLQSVTDGMGNNSPLQLSTTQVAVVGALGGGIIIKDLTATTGALWSKSVTPSSTNYAIALQEFRTLINGPTEVRFLINDSAIGNIQTAGLALGIGSTAASARLHVRGDGTNPIVRFETGAGTQAFAINNNGGITIARDGNIGPQIYPFNLLETSQDILGFGLGFTSNKVNFVSNNYDVFFNGQNYTATSGVANYVTIRRTFAAAAGAASFRPLNLEYTINNSGAQTGTATGIFLNATETALNGMTHNLMDLQVGGVSQFKVDKTGIITSNLGMTTTSGSGAFQITNKWAILGGAVSGDFQILPWTGTAVKIQLGGTTNAFPAIKRNGATIDFRLADDSAFCSINAFGGTFSSTLNTARVEMNGDYMGFNSNAAISGGGLGVLNLVPWSGSNFRLNIGGNTNAFPAIKRSSAAIDFRLADDSAFCAITASGFTSRQNSSGANMLVFIDNLGSQKFANHMSSGNFYLYNYATALNVYSIGANDSINFGNAVAVASARVQIDSTTQGFLPPRMTTTQVNAIASPAEGLVVFNTTISHLCVYQGGAWVKINHSPM